MVGQCIGCFSCMLCAIPFFVIAKLGKEGKDPIAFWSGDTSLKNIIVNVKEYNRGIAKLYNYYGLVFAVSGILMLFAPIFGLILCLVNSSLGIFVVFKVYKKLVNRYS